MRILITGATGLIGNEIVKLCREQQIGVHYLTTSKSKIEEEEDCRGFYWNAKQGDIDIHCFEGVGAIIHLAGAPISEPWTSSYKTEILESRILTGNLLFNTLQKNKHQVKQFISASGINIYPSDYDNTYTEDSSETATTFLGNVVRSWEEVADKFYIGGVKVAKIRTGMVLDSKEGALPKLVKPVKFGVGAPLASGKQWQSWIHIEDIARVYMHVLTKSLEGSFNAVSPDPVTNKQMTKAIANHLNKPLLLPNVPKFMLELALGERATLVLESQKVSSYKIEVQGFEFKYPDIESALNDLL